MRKTLGRVLRICTSNRTNFRKLALPVERGAAAQSLEWSKIKIQKLSASPTAQSAET
jgi:hypothetical protein